MKTAPTFVMAGLVPAIHVFACNKSKTWMPGSSPVMTVERARFMRDGVNQWR